MAALSLDLSVDQLDRFAGELDLPDFHAPRHSAAMDCDDAEQARMLLRHKNSNVTRAIYRAHFGDRERELLRARLEARHGSGAAAEAPAMV
jgi:integrase